MEDQAAPAANNRAPPGQQAGTFALTPAAGTQSNVLDYVNNKMHRSHYQAAIKSLYRDSDARFDLSEKNLQNFLSRLEVRAKEFNFCTLDVPINNNFPLGQTDNLIRHHGKFTLEHISTFANTFLGTPSRAAQDDYMLYQCLINSVDEDAFNELSAMSDEYIIGEHSCGVLLLKVIIRESAADAAIAPDTVKS